MYPPNVAHFFLPFPQFRLGTKNKKCDEGKPTCLKCTKKDRSCVYGVKVSPDWKKDVRILSLPRNSRSVTQTFTNKQIIAQPLTRPLVNGIPTVKSYLNTLSGLENLGVYPTPSPTPAPAPTEEFRGFGIQDVQLLTHFSSSTSLDLFGSTKLWTEDVVKLSFQVSLELSLTHLSSDNFILTKISSIPS